MPAAPGYPDQPSVLAVAPGGDIGSEKPMKAGGRIIGDLAEADTPRAAAAILDLDGADNQHFALMAASAAPGDRIGFAAASEFGFIHFDETGERAAARGEHAAAQFGAE